MPGPLPADYLDIIHRHSLPLAVDDRDVFVAEVIDALERVSVLGPGLVSRTCRERQPAYLSRIVGVPRHPPRVAAEIEATPKRRAGRTPGTQWERRGYHGGWR